MNWMGYINQFCCVYSDTHYPRTNHFKVKSLRNALRPVKQYGDVKVAFLIGIQYNIMYHVCRVDFIGVHDVHYNINTCMRLQNKRCQ